MTRTGDRREIIELQQPVKTDDGGGGQVTTWLTVSTERVRVKREQSLARDFERIRAGGLVPQPMVRIYIRANPATLPVDNGWRALNVRTREVMDIQAVQFTEESSREMMLTAILTGRDNG